MINITDIAQKELETYLSENKIVGKIRIYLPQSGCGGAHLSMTVDEPTETDNVKTFGTLTLFIDKGLNSQTGKVTVDFKTEDGSSGFVVEAENDLNDNQGDNHCGSCSSCG